MNKEEFQDELNQCIRKFGEAHKGKSGDEILNECRGIVPLADQYKEVCNAYRDALNEMWDTNGEWLDNDMWWFDVADCVIGIAEVRELVDRKVDFDTFLAWYDYDMQIHYAESIGKPVNRINLHTWLNGYPEDKKVPQEQRDAWEKEYWKQMVEVDNSEYDYGHDV